MTAIHVQNLIDSLCSLTFQRVQCTCLNDFMVNPWCRGFRLQTAITCVVITRTGQKMTKIIVLSCISLLFRNLYTVPEIIVINFNSCKWDE